eukprot:CAMPEP_0203951202 /NCGR_PEP_ID=MMETSP0359-20131031/85167_1 /ASSEMBLY_ACC=CAM_ASM_000338 /TAXON_ID=268821 /ORGANISM="Scrippsiella Hangoei, Strain SHTV-5" /LENGTH=193 /DNA_ID=CAMNT_0050883729 /DNA_START=378 /DNA_END=957 /DNA_ORIENTATION=-
MPMYAPSGTIIILAKRSNTRVVNKLKTVVANKLFPTFEGMAIPCAPNTPSKTQPTRQKMRRTKNPASTLTTKPPHKHHRHCPNAARAQLLCEPHAGHSSYVRAISKRLQRPMQAMSMRWHATSLAKRSHPSPKSQVQQMCRIPARRKPKRMAQISKNVQWTMPPTRQGDAALHKVRETSGWVQTFELSNGKGL